MENNKETIKKALHEFLSDMETSNGELMDAIDSLSSSTSEGFQAIVKRLLALETKVKGIDVLTERVERMEDDIHNVKIDLRDRCRNRADCRPADNQTGRPVIVTIWMGEW